MTTREAIRSLTPDRRSLGVALGAAMAAFLWRLAAGSHPVDDAYITFRYAANLAQGLGLVYNPGSWVLGTSTPLMAVLLAAAAAIVGPERIPTASLVLNALFDSASVLLIAAIGSRLRFPLGARVLAACLFAFSPVVVRYSIGGMEAPLATMLTLGTIYLFLSHRNGLAAVLAGFAILARPDVLAVGVALAGAQLLSRKRGTGRTVLIIGLWLGAIVVALALIYGSPIPQSVWAKAGRTYQAGAFTNAAQFAYALGGFPFLSWTGMGARGLLISPDPSLAAAASLFFVVVAAGWALGIRELMLRDPAASILAFYPVVFMTTYVAFGFRGSLLAEWYLPPLLSVWIMPLVHGLWLAVPGLRMSYPRVTAAIVIGAMATELAGYDLGRGGQSSAWVPLATWEEREVLYARAADFLRPRMRSDDVVAASEIGSLGYFCGCQILDTVGLVSPEAQAYYPLPPGRYASNYAIPVDLILDQRPDFLVSLEVFLRDTLKDNSDFTAAYRLIWRAPTSAFGSDGLLVYRLDPTSGP